MTELYAMSRAKIDGLRFTDGNTYPLVQFELVMLGVYWLRPDDGRLDHLKGLPEIEWAILPPAAPKPCIDIGFSRL
jgi:hypothetical protein